MHRLERSQPKLLAEPVGIDAIALVGRFAPPAKIAHHHLLGVRRQQIVKPLRLGSLLESHVHARTQSTHQTDDGPCLGRHRCAHHDLPLLVPHTRYGRCLVHIQREILSRLLFHGSRPFLSFVVFQFQTYRKGRAFNMR